MLSSIKQALGKVTQKQRDVAGYAQILADIGMSEESVQKEVNRNDVITIKNVFVADSKIQGKGCFTARKVLMGNIVCPARIKEYRTTAGRYTNHSEKPNTVSKCVNGNFVLYALRDLEKDEELLLDYRQVIEENKQAQQQ